MVKIATDNNRNTKVQMCFCLFIHKYLQLLEKKKKRAKLNWKTIVWICSVCCTTAKILSFRQTFSVLKTLSILLLILDELKFIFLITQRMNKKIKKKRNTFSTNKIHFLYAMFCMRWTCTVWKYKEEQIKLSAIFIYDIFTGCDALQGILTEGEVWKFHFY